MQTPTHRKNTWMKSTQIWLKRLLGDNTLQSFPRNIEFSRLLKRTVQTTVRECRHAVSRASDAGLTLYWNYNLAYTCKYWWEALGFPGLARGSQWLAKIRVGGFWLAPALSRIGTPESHWESHCPCCGDEIPETMTYLGLQCPRWKQELDVTVIFKGRTLTLSVALATDGLLTEPQRSLVANKLTLYLLGGRSSESDAHTGPVLSAPTYWWVSSRNPHCQPTTTHSMHDHEGERRLPGFILTVKFLQRVVRRRQACIRRLSKHKLTMRPDSTSGEPCLEPTPSVVWKSRSVSVQRPHRRFRRRCCRFRQARHTMGRMKRPEYPKRSTSNVTWR